MDETSQEIMQLAEAKLGAGNYSIKSVSYEQVFEYYRAADLFALASLAEGFGRVYLESLMHGLPTLGHSHPVIEYVLGSHGKVTDMETSGTLALAISREMSLLSNSTIETKQRMAAERVEDIRARFSWDILRADYLRMFHYVAHAQCPG